MNAVPSIYGILISFAILMCLLVAEKRAKKDAMRSGTVWDLGLTAIVSGVLGARLYHVTHLWEFYSQNPSQIIDFSKGGLGIWGGIVAGITAVCLQARFRKQKPLYWLDLFAGVLPLGQAIGRWGNYFNQENFGSPTSGFWGIYIEPNKRPSDFVNYDRFRPLFLYEFILNLILFFILTKLEKKRSRGGGFIFGFYILGYSTIRFFLEFLRIDPWQIQGINTAQGICVVSAAAALVFLKNRWRCTIN